MKGENTIIINREQMVSIVQAWWDDAQSGIVRTDTVTTVESNSNNGFVIAIEESIKVEWKGD